MPAQLPHTPAFTRTRLAPTPSGYLHLGNAFSFALTAALARKYGARILLRIDDLDRERCGLKYVQDIFDTLDYLEIPWDEGPRNIKEYRDSYSQAHRLHLYETMLEELRAAGHIYACTCSRSDVARESAEGIYPGTCRIRNIPVNTRDACWRLDTSRAGTVRVKMPGGQMRESPFPASMRDFVVRKKDGFPAYQLASVADDAHFSVDLVVRGEDLWPSTCAQLYLSSALGKSAFGHTSFFHHRLLAGPDGKKLSKSAGDTAVRQLRKQGMKPAHVYSLMAGALAIPEPLAGWPGLAGHMRALSAPGN
ncbi:MAG: glutamate--tRNA ligase family protein [Bacteroidota bacterium]